jgi:hypothetical protein
MIPNSEILTAIQNVIKTFEKLLIPYFIGGSVASSIYGTARSTLDIDLIAEIKSNQVLFLKKELANEYYIDEDMIFDAILRKSSFNLIHLKTMVKVDVFIHKNEPYDKEIFKRKRKDTLDGSEKSLECFFSSPEDIIINKLKWYKDGGEISERQWLDILGVIKVQAKSLDKIYLERWTKQFYLFELLKRAFNEAEIDL